MKPLIALLLAIQVSGFVREGAVEIIFPQAIRFTVNLSIAPTDIASAELTITVEGHDPISLNVDVEQAAQATETGAHLEYIWRLSADDPPPLFETIAYHWSFRSADGSTGTLDESFTFADPRINWMRLDPQGRFNVSAARSLAPLVDSLSQVHALLERGTGRRLDDNLLIYAFDPGCTPAADNSGSLIARAPGGATVICDPGIAEAVLAEYRILYLRLGVADEGLIVGTLVREAYAPLWDGKAVPEWFSEGLAQFYAPTPKNALLPPALQAARDGTLLSLSEMQIAQTTALWRAQSFGMVLYIADNIGFNGLTDLARVDAEDFNAAYERVMGIPLSALVPAWQQWIFSRAASSVYGITPYQPPTPTPTFTPTANTTPTASATPTVTPTPTPTFTSTPRGGRTFAPPPTVMPSSTFTPQPPTVTPRPPGSLPTITPTPTALQVAVAQPGVRTGVAVFLVVLLVLLVFLFIRLGNRR